LLLICTTSLMAQKKTVAGVWSAAKANAWYAQHKWINGANFTPSTAINQLEMWQADTFDPQPSTGNWVMLKALVLMPCACSCTASFGKKTQRD